MADNADEGGSGAPGGGSPEGGQGKDDAIPKSQFLAALKSAEEKRQREVAELRSEFEAKLAKATERPAEQVKRYSRADLLAAVANNQITQEQADTEWERQIREDARTDAARTAASVVNEGQRKERVDSEIARYKALAPEILDDSHESRQKIRSAYQDLVSLGDDPRDVATQLKAIRQVLGPVDLLEQARKGKPSHDDHRETGGGGEGDRKPSGKTPFDRLDARQKAHYERLIQQGVYKDKAAVEDELKYARRRA